MNKSLIAAGLIAAGCFGTNSASAASLTVNGVSAPALDGGITLVHMGGTHRACELGPNGWHRHNWRGVRIACRPARPGLRYWIWRKADGREGWWHSRDRRWN